MANGRFQENVKRWSKPVGMALVFLFFLLVFDRLLFLGFRELAFQFYGGESSRNTNEKWARNYERYQGIVFGSSRSRRGFDARTIGKILKGHVNLAAKGGRYPAFNLLFFKHLQPHLGGIRFVIYGIDYFMFGQRSNRLQMAMVKRLTKVEMFGTDAGKTSALPMFVQPLLLISQKPDIEEFLSDVFNKRLKKIARQKKGPGKRPRRAVRGSGAEKLGKIVQHKKGPGHRPGQAVRGSGTRVPPDPPLHWRRRKFPRFPGVEGRDFLKMLEELSRKGIVTFLVFLPDYVGTNATNYEQEAFKAEFRGLAARFRSVHLLDFNNPKRFQLSNPDLFSDGGWGRSNSHLSRIGRRIFSRKVSFAIQSLLPAR